MNRTIQGALLACSLFQASAAPARALETDVNIVTAMDISDSMESHDVQMEIIGMARAVRSRAVLEAIQAGPNGRVGFAVFAWHSGSVFAEFVSWTVIETEADAARVSAQLIDCLKFANRSIIRTPNEMRSPSGLTDISGAIQYGADLLRSAPFATNRSVVNIIGNGTDNVWDGPRATRDALIAEGRTINGVVLSGDPSLVDYFHQEVVGGPGSFLLPIFDADTTVSMLIRKLKLDIVSSAGGERSLEKRWAPLRVEEAGRRRQPSS